MIVFSGMRVLLAVRHLVCWTLVASLKRRRFNALVIVMSAAVSLMISHSAHAADRVDELTKQLQTSDDFRVRTQAALALGSTKSERAVSPLCKGLEDSSKTVRAAAAAALGKLALGGRDCLAKRIQAESSSAVKGVMEKALARLDQAPPDVGIPPNTRYYVAIETSDRTERGDASVDSIIRRGMKKAASGTAGCVLAPPSQTLEQAKALLAKHTSVKPFLLSVSVKKPASGEGKLKIKLELAIFTYPGRVLKGMLPVSLTQSGGDADRATEDALFEAAAERAFAKFVESAASID